jgi:uncharacterized membrane protein
MDELLAPLFALICGQNPAHTWAPGGSALPFCQRCTGLYAGAALAAALLLVLRPRATSRFLWVHGAFLLAMAPQGFHLVYQNEVLRVVSGTLFAFGATAFLMPELEGRGSTRAYALGVCAAPCALLALGEYGGGAGAVVLRVLALAGFCVYALLATRFAAVCARRIVGRKAARAAA